MKITLEWLKEKHACSEVVDAFSAHFTGGEADYQAVLDETARLNRMDWASWLLNAAGPINAELKIEGDLIAECGIAFAGRIIVTGRIQANFVIAGGDIEAGADYGIYAGLSIRVSQKVKYAVVIANTRPKYLLLGDFREAK